MKKIITTVGTSLITNNLDVGNIKEHFEKLKNQPYEENNDRAEKLKNELKKIKTNNQICAEIDSINKIASEIKDDIEVYLIATDTILSPICANYIKDYLSANKIKAYFEFNQKYIIEKLQIKNKVDFEKIGLTNLFTRIQEIADKYWDNCILNITGGYKALIPYMSIIAQINKIPAYYIFQENKDEKFALLKIPNIPINIDYSLFEKYWNELLLVSENAQNPNNFQFETDLSSILEKDSNSMMLTSLGYVLWEKYKEKYFIFYCPDDVWDEMQKQKDIMRILSDKFWSDKHRESKTEKKQQHYVFDDGNNNNRIYYFEEEKKIFIYKTFENEENAKKFINVKIENNIIQKDSKQRKIEINK